jgi:succinate dehydrogenase hydrophobic anchor subunit
LAVAAFIVFAVRHTPSMPWAAWTVVLGNAAWVLGSVLLLVAGFEHPTTLGMAYVIAQAVIVAIIAELEYTGLKRLAGSPAVLARS